MGNIGRVFARRIDVRIGVEPQCLDVLHRTSILRKKQANKVNNSVFLLSYKNINLPFQIIITQNNLSDTSTENLRYLNVDQALADLAYFIETKKKEKKLEESSVIVFGGSYAGNMAAWARLKYPHLIQVSIPLFSCERICMTLKKICKTFKKFIFNRVL